MGFGLGTVAGLAVGTWLLRSVSELIGEAIEKATYAVAFPHSAQTPIQAPDPETIHAFDPQDVDDERIPDWMDEDYPMAGSQPMPGAPDASTH